MGVTYSNRLQNVVIGNGACGMKLSGVFGQKGGVVFKRGRLKRWGFRNHGSATFQIDKFL